MDVLILVFVVDSEPRAWSLCAFVVVHGACDNVAVRVAGTTLLVSISGRVWSLVVGDGLGGPESKS